MDISNYLQHLADDHDYEFLNRRLWWDDFDLHYESLIIEIKKDKKRASERKRLKLNKRHVYQIMKRSMDKNISRKIGSRLQSRIWRLLKGRRVKFRYNISALLGCDMAALKSHLESKFSNGMSWDNYGKWHVDHIRPCASFNLINESELRECFNFKNLQPLWAEANMKKGNIYNGKRFRKNNQPCQVK